MLLALCPAALGQKIPLAVGQQFQPPALTLLDGTPVDWQRLRGNILILEFWASWCPFCARQNPLLDRFYREHQSRGLEVITISLDKTKDAALGYMKKGGYAFKAGMATEDWTAIYRQRQGLPQVFVIDRLGKIAAIEVREMMEEDIRELARFL
jgi:thiol-disulfide isomerase/thioredoxin